jgi:hypothetical protein
MNILSSSQVKRLNGCGRLFLGQKPSAPFGPHSRAQRTAGLHLPNQLSDEEFSIWSAAANAHNEVSDAALATLESAAASESAATSRLSCSSESREPRFLGWAEHIRSFLIDQAKALGVRACRQGRPSQPQTAAPTAPQVGPRGFTGRRRRSPRSPTRNADSGWPARLWSPPEYRGPKAQHVADKKAEFEKRKTCGACFACLNTRVQYGTFHL